MTNHENPCTVRELLDLTEHRWRAWVEAIDGIPDERLAEPVTGHWTGKDLLGHVAFWEEWAIDECQRILAGAPNSDEDLEPLNQAQVADSKDASAAEQKQYRDEAHARLMAFLATIPEDTPVFPALVKALEWETYRHYDEHAAEVRAWRKAAGVWPPRGTLMTDEQESRQAPKDVNALLDRIEGGWRALLQALDDIPEDRLEEAGACGAWSIKNLMGHIAFWDEQAVAKIERTLAGLPDDDSDFQALNEADHTARLGRTLAEERSAMHQAHAAAVARLEEVAGLEAGDLDAAISPDTYNHYAEHAADIRHWRQREGI